MKLYLIEGGAFLKSVSVTGDERKDSVLRYDAVRFAVALQGILNRESPKLCFLTEAHDRFWLEYLSEKGSLLDGYEREEISSFTRLLEVFSKEISSLGLILWDENVPATVNAATTACGAEGFLPMRGSDETLLSLIRQSTGAKVRADLRGIFTGKGTIPGTKEKSTGSAKCDAYVWALAKYGDVTDPTLLFYTLDGVSWSEDGWNYPDLGNAFVYNHDYAISRRAFVFDLSSYDDETPCDDPDQPLGTDYATMIRILGDRYERTGGKEMITVCGFNPWQLKYTRHGGKGKHGEVDAEWRFTEVISAYNCIKDADAAGYCALANASVYRHFRLKEKYDNRRPAKELSYDPETNYVLLYIGDYDASAWTARFIPRWYRDPALGRNPLMWCFNPNLSDRIPQAFDFVYSHYTGNDYFEAGDSGAGYNNPRLLTPPRVHSALPSGVETWVGHNRKYFGRFDMSVIGFVIDGDELTNEAEMADMSRFAPLGVGYLSLGHDLETKIVGGTVFLPVTSDIAAERPDPRASARNLIAGIYHTNERKQFHIFRTILCSPSDIDAIIGKAKELAPELHLEFVDPFNFFRLAKEAKEKGLTW